MSKAPEYWSKAKKVLSEKDKVMKKLINNYKDGSLVTRNDVFFSLCKSIIGQQISVAAANSVFLKFKKKCKNKINAKKCKPSSKTGLAASKPKNSSFLYLSFLALHQHTAKNIVPIIT